MSDKVINKGKEVAFSSKGYKTDKTNKISIDKLIHVFYSFLRFIIIDLCGFCLLTTVIDDLIQLVYEVNVKAFKVLPEYSKVEVSQLFIPGYKDFLSC